MFTHPPDADPMGVIASYILDKEGTEDVIIISLDKSQGKIDLACACKDITNVNNTKAHRLHLIGLLKYVIADMEKPGGPKLEGSYLMKPVKDKEPEQGDDSISVNE